MRSFLRWSTVSFPRTKAPGPGRRECLSTLTSYWAPLPSTRPTFGPAARSLGRYGGKNGFERFHSLTALEELAWRTRIEGSLGIPERERLGPVVGLQERYVAGLAASGAGISFAFG